MAGITTERPILYHTLPGLSTPHPLFERLHTLFHSVHSTHNLGCALL